MQSEALKSLSNQINKKGDPEGNALGEKKMTYIIRVERIENCYVEADNYEEAINKVLEGNSDKIVLISSYYSSIKDGEEEWD